MSESLPDISKDQGSALETHDINNSSYSAPVLPDNWNYETTVTTVESIIAQIETGELSIADVFDQFETAVHHLQQCESFLSHHRQKADLLIETLNDGEEFVD